LPRQLENAPRCYTSHKKWELMIDFIQVPGKKKDFSRCHRCHLDYEKDALNRSLLISLDVFILVYKYQVSILRREASIARQLYNEVKSTMPVLSMITKAYDFLLPSSPFCKYAVQCAAHTWKSKQCHKSHDEEDQLSEKLTTSLYVCRYDTSVRQRLTA